MDGYYRNNYYRPSDRRAALLSNLACSLLFIIFSLVYIIAFQKDIIETLHFSLAHGKTKFALIPTAIVLTSVFVLLGTGVKYVTKLRNRFTALAYLPSFLGLIALTDIGRGIYMSSYSGFWWWLMPVLSIIFVGGCIILKRDNRYRKEPELDVLIWNISLMLIMCILTMCMSNTDKSMHNELEMEGLIIKEKYDKALETAGKSTEATRTMTALRGIAMAKAGNMGDMIFSYPQYYKADGLFFENDSTKTFRFNNDSVYSIIGYKARNWETPEMYLKRVCCEEDSVGNTAWNYYMAVLLLNKNLEAFANVLDSNKSAGDEMGKYFKEAAVLYKSMNPGWNNPAGNDSLSIADIKAYRTRQKEIANKSEKERMNILRKEFGDSYWWYYDYQK